MDTEKEKALSSMLQNVKSSREAEEKYLKIIKEQSVLHAVKACKDDTGCGVKEAKEYIDSLREKHGLPMGGKGCMVAFLMLSSTLMALSALFFFV